MTVNGVNIEDIDEVISRATKAAIKEFDKEKKMEQKKKTFHNTKLLLAHYNDLKEHVRNAIDDVNKLEGDLLDLGDLERDELYILSIKRSKAKTLIMIAHIDMSLETLRQKQIKLCAIEKYEALKMYFIDEMTYEEIQEKFTCGVNTPRRWVNEMINKLSILLFGVDGIKDIV